MDPERGAMLTVDLPWATRTSRKAIAFAISDSLQDRGFRPGRRKTSRVGYGCRDSGDRREFRGPGGGLGSW